MSHRCRHEGRCLIPPHPELRARMQQELARMNASASLIGPMLRAVQPKRPGLNDGLIIPGNFYPIGTPLERVRNAAAERAPLRGEVRVVVVLAEFPDLRMEAGHDQAYFNNLFFSRGALPNGSVREYFAEASGGQIDIVGEVVGPYLMPRPITAYAHGESGTGNAQPNARTMARDAAAAADGQVNFGRYDNDGNGFVDAFIVIHAGSGAEETGSANDIWSHKWVLSGGEYSSDGTKIFAYLTVPEEARIGVCCHELGHLLFGWPDLYDIDGSSEGLGNWCLMAGGSWNGSGDIPAHPSAWCKAEQGWVNVVNQTTNATVSIADVKSSSTVYRLWKDGTKGSEYFLVENRQRTLYDRKLPGDGLLIFHIDEAVETNEDERHPKVALIQADGRNDLSLARNRGDAGDAFPGTMQVTSLTATSTPDSKAYGGNSSGVSITAIGRSGPIISAKLAVRAEVAPRPRRRRGFWDLFWSQQQPQMAAFDPSSLQPFMVRQLLAEAARGELATPFLRGSRYDEAWARSVDERLRSIEALLTLMYQERGGLAEAAAGEYEPES